MRPLGKRFDGSDSLFKTQQDLVKRAGHAVWLTEFIPARLDHLGFVNRLLQTFCELDICCALVNTYPAYIAGALSVMSNGGQAISLLYIARADSPILDNIYNKLTSFQIGPFSFARVASEEYANYREYSLYAVTQGDVTIELLLGVVRSPSLVDKNLTSIYSNSCGILRLFLHSKCTGLSAFPSTHLKSSTLGITGLLAVAGRRIRYAASVSGTIGLYSTLSYPRVRVRALARVMCLSDNPRLCEV